MIRNNLIVDGRILVDIDYRTGESIYSDTTIETKTEEELVKLAFDVFCREQVRPQFTNIARSYKAIIEALILLLRNMFLVVDIHDITFQCLILTNKDFFMDILTQAKEKYLPVRRMKSNQNEKMRSRNAFGKFRQLLHFQRIL
jgi:hypothetical protein